MDPGLPLKQASAIPTSLSTTPVLCVQHTIMCERVKNCQPLNLPYCIVFFAMARKAQCWLLLKSFTSLDNNVSICYVYLDYDECTSGPCLNGGTCVNGKRKFSCICPRTHKGRICEGRLAS